MPRIRDKPLRGPMTTLSCKDLLFCPHGGSETLGPEARKVARRSMLARAKPHGEHAKHAIMAEETEVY
jgi:hypothetical protein